MEMETSTMPPKAPRLTVGEEALASQVMEIIGGITLKALQTAEEPEDRDVWSMEEGDDSVFYSDEDQTPQDIKARASPDFGANVCKHLVDNVAAIAQREDDPEEESIQENPEMNEVTRQVILTAQEEERQELQMPKTEPMDQSDPADPGAQSNPEKSVSICGEFKQQNCTIADMRTQPVQNVSAEKANLPVEEEEAALDAQTLNLEPFDVTNEESYTRLNGEEKLPEQMSSAELKIPRMPQEDQEPGQDHNFHPGYSTLPLPKQSGRSDGHQRSFNHLTSSKYSTVSYRKIRRGNTRQKIDDFEYMIMNL